MGVRLSGNIIGVAAGLVLPVAAAPAQSLPNPEVQGPIIPRIVPECRTRPGEEIVVCGRRERSPYRLPEPPPRFDPEAGVDSVSRERNALLDHGDSGIGSCSNSGPGAGFGCTFKKWKHEEQQRQGHRNQRRLIQKFRDRYEPEPLPSQ